MRAVIKEVFPERDGFTLVRPVLEEAQLAKLETLPPSQLRPEFRKVRRGWGPGWGRGWGCCPGRRRWLPDVPRALVRPARRLGQHLRRRAQPGPSGRRLRAGMCTLPRPRAALPPPPCAQGMTDLRGVILRKAAPMRLGSQLLTGAALAGLAQAYVAAINAGAVPQLLNAWQVPAPAAAAAACACPRADCTAARCALFLPILPRP
jgi:hypothetical protein